MLDLRNTAIAFAYKSSSALKRSAWLFRLMNRSWLVSLGSRLTLLGFRLRLPIGFAVKNTIFQQFCGGSSFDECLKNINTLAQYGVDTVLDYGAEAKDSELEYDRTVEENMRAILFAAQASAVKIISIKVTGLTSFALLEKYTAGQAFSPSDEEAWQAMLARLDRICQAASQAGISLFIDAEESWIQNGIDEACTEMMQRYNSERAVVWNTFQLYRHDRLAFLKESHKLAKQGKYILGAKLVRGAYMEKERARAEKMGYLSPIQADKAACDRDYDLALRYCVEHYEKIASCVASHNELSTLLQVELMQSKGISPKHPHLSFCQLYGMSDTITFNLAKAGYQVSKYMPYGPVRDVIPYLIRRAQENSSVDGEMSRELQLVEAELQRRKKQGL